MTRKRCEHSFQRHCHRNPCQRDNQVPRGGEGGGGGRGRCKANNQLGQWWGGVNDNDPGGGAMWWRRKQEHADKADVMVGVKGGRIERTVNKSSGMCPVSINFLNNVGNEEKINSSSSIVIARLQVCRIIRKSR